MPLTVIPELTESNFAEHQWSLVGTVAVIGFANSLQKHNTVLVGVLKESRNCYFYFLFNE